MTDIQRRTGGIDQECTLARLLLGCRLWLVDCADQSTSTAVVAAGNSQRISESLSGHGTQWIHCSHSQQLPVSAS